MSNKKNFSFKFEIIFLILAIIFGAIVLAANFMSPFLNQYVFVGIIALMALGIAAIIAMSILITKANRN